MKTPSNPTRAVAKGKVVHKWADSSSAFTECNDIVFVQGTEDWNKTNCVACLKLRRGNRGK